MDRDIFSGGGELSLLLDHVFKYTERGTADILNPHPPFPLPSPLYSLYVTFFPIPHPQPSPKKRKRGG